MPGAGRHAALRHLARSFSLQARAGAGGEIESVGQPVEDMSALAYALLAFAPISRAAAAQQHQTHFLLFRLGFPGFARTQTPHKEAHPFPVRALARQAEQLA